MGGLKHQKEKRSMVNFAGLDVSVKETSVCIVDDAGEIVRVLLALTLAALETFLSGDNSLSALEAAMATGGSTKFKPGPTK
jgi:hypothetical protein